MVIGVTKILLKSVMVGITHKQIGTEKQEPFEWMKDEKAQQKIFRI